MPRLIHLNGPSRVGKSSLARRWVDEHPGCLRLDLDVLTGLIGGWRQDFAGAHAIARPLGWAMATRHLQAGHDVVVPQLVTSRDTGPGLDEVAREAKAEYVEVALLIDEEEHLRRLRNKEPSNEVEWVIQDMLEDPLSDVVSRIRQHLSEYLQGRPQTIRLDTTALEQDSTYARLSEVLATA